MTDTDADIEQPAASDTPAPDPPPPADPPVPVPQPAPAWGTPAAQSTPDPRRWLALLTVLTAAFMVLLDISIVNVAIPSIQSNLHASYADVQLVLAGYALGYALFLITGGRLGDIYGRKRLFMIGMAGFVAASALCGLAQSPTMLVVSRVFQGLMAALMYPQVLSVIQVVFPPQERGKAFGVFGGIIGIATITGPLVGGLIIRDDITGSAWRWIFLVNLPIGVASLIAAMRFLPESRAPQAHRLDLVGVAILSGGLGLLVYPLVEGRDLGWPAWSFAMMIASPIVIALFVLYERRLQEGGSPLVLLSLFRNRAFTAGWLVSGVFFCAVPAFFFVFSLMMQIGLGWSALHAGLTTMPFAFGSAVASAMSVRLAPRLGRWILAIGCGGLVLGMLLLVATLSAGGESTTSLELVPALLVSGLGLGSTIAPLLNVILAGVSGKEAGSASGLITTMQQIGAAIGVAVIGVIFFGLLGNRAGGVADGIAPQLHADAASALAAQGTPAAQTGVVASSITAAFHTCFVDRSNEKDPTVVPASCAPPPGVDASGPVGQAVGSAASLALARNFVGAMERTVFFNMALWALSAVMVLVGLPDPRRRASSSSAGAVAAH